MDEQKEKISQRLEQLAAIMGIVDSRLEPDKYSTAKGKLKYSGLDLLRGDIIKELQNFAENSMGSIDLIHEFITIINSVDLHQRGAFEELGKRFHSFTKLQEDEKPIEEPEKNEIKLPKPFDDGPGGLH